MTAKRLTEEQHEAMSAALTTINASLDKAFGRCAIAIVVKPLDNTAVGIVSNVPPKAADTLLRYALNAEDAEPMGHTPSKKAYD